MSEPRKTLFERMQDLARLEPEVSQQTDAELIERALKAERFYAAYPTYADERELVAALRARLQALSTTRNAGGVEYAPCPLCHQYSHSIGEDQLSEAFNHFQSMFCHRGDGIPTQHTFDEKTRDAAQVLMAAARSEHPPSVVKELVERLQKLDCAVVEVCEPHPGNPLPNIIVIERKKLLSALSRVQRASTENET